MMDIYIYIMVCQCQKNAISSSTGHECCKTLMLYAAKKRELEAKTITHSSSGRMINFKNLKSSQIFQGDKL